MKRTVMLCFNMSMGMLFFSLPSYIQKQHQEELKITGIRSPKGKILVNIFKDNASYDHEQPWKKLSFDKQALADSSLILHCALDPGIYGFTIVDDENDNGKIDKNLIGMPKEGFGFSNFFMTKMKKPGFDDFKVDLNARHDILIRVKYM